MNIFTELATNGGDWKRKYGDAWKKQIEKVKTKFGDAIEKICTPWDAPTDVPIFYVKKKPPFGAFDFFKNG